ncbi:unnamed protein product [Knipowitschia caucasica]|uniref:TGF-beta family profile domain-containing protein n=1 Tax=Knipowitschia caucasica TaxID=637954 RepID=A0AAV2LJY4_KNICA
MHATTRRAPNALSAVLLSQILLLLPVFFLVSTQETSAVKDGVEYSRFRLLDRPTGHHLPTYMVHLYRNFTTNFSKPVDAIERSGAKRADTVKSVVAKSLTYRETRWIATFDLRTLLLDRQIQAAELRIRLPQNHSVSNVSVDIYHHQICPPPNASRPCPEQLLLGTFNQSALVTGSQNWEVYNITSPLLSWLQNRKALKVRSRRIVRGKTVEKSQKILADEVNDRALLVVFSQTDLDGKTKPKASLLHTAEQSKFLSPAEVKKAKRHKKRRSKRGHTGLKKPLCRRVDLQVDFNRIGWGSWIVFPKRYNAFRCEGECPGPLGGYLNPTNHAYMQSLFQHFQPERVASPCCAPTRMSPLSMLYFENGEMLLRHHEDMIVEECGCQ